MRIVIAHVQIADTKARHERDSMREGHACAPIEREHVRADVELLRTGSVQQILVDRETQLPKLKGHLQLDLRTDVTPVIGTKLIEGADRGRAEAYRHHRIRR